MEAEAGTEDEVEQEAEAVEWPDPDKCRRKGSPGGVPVVLCDRKTWELARGGLWKRLELFRDTIYDEVTLCSTAPIAHIRAAAFWLLRANYDLTEGQAHALIMGTEPSAIADAVIDCLTTVNAGRKTFSSWARGSLLANGIKPADVPPDDLPHVLATLVLTGRAVEASDYTDSGVAAAKRSGLAMIAAKIKADAPVSPAQETE